MSTTPIYDALALAGPHQHQWVDVTEMSDRVRTYRCTVPGCEAVELENLEPAPEVNP